MRFSRAAIDRPAVCGAKKSDDPEVVSLLQSLYSVGPHSVLSPISLSSSPLSLPPRPSHISPSVSSSVAWIMKVSPV